MNKFFLSKVVRISDWLYSKDFELNEYDYEDEDIPSFPRECRDLETGWLLKKYKTMLDGMTISRLRKYPTASDYEEIKKLPAGAKRALQARIILAQKDAQELDMNNKDVDDMTSTLWAIALLLRY